MMTDSELKALVSLLEDEDKEIFDQVEQEILGLGEEVIPFLEEAWEVFLDPMMQQRIEDIIHSISYKTLKKKLRKWKQDEPDDLLKGMWLVATYMYPDLALEDLQSEVTSFCEDPLLNFSDKEISPHEQVKLMNDFFFLHLNFRGNTKNFHSPANSMINVVLQSKRGNPISLSVLYMLIARHHGLPILGVNLPNLFVLTYKDESTDTQFYISTFNRGLVYSRDDIDNYIDQLKLKSLEIFYEPCNNVDIIQRVLRNLSVAFEKLGDLEKQSEIDDLLDAITSGK